MQNPAGPDAISRHFEHAWVRELAVALDAGHGFHRFGFGIERSGMGTLSGGPQETAGDRRIAAAIALGVGISLAVLATVVLSPDGNAPVAVAPLPAHPFTVTRTTAGTATTQATLTATRAGDCRGGTTSRLSIPSLGITAPLIGEPLVHDSLSIPPDVQTVGWWTGGGQLVGSTGTVLVAGHVDWAGQGDGALYPLAGIQPGATICTTAATGAVASWAVSSAIAVAKTTLPQTVFAATGPRRLVVVTCGGAFDSQTGHYADNVVVRATPVADGDAS
jgi:hypothetical protein